MSGLRAKMAAQRFVIDEVIRFILDVVGDGVKSNKENTSSEEGDAVFNPADVKGTGDDQPEEKKM